MYLQSQFPKVALGVADRHLIFWGYVLISRGQGGSEEENPIPNRYDAPKPNSLVGIAHHYL